MPADAKLSLLKTIQTQFDKLQNDIGLPSTGSLTTSSSELVVTKVKNDTAVNKQAPRPTKQTLLSKRNLVKLMMKVNVKQMKSCPMINQPPCLFNSWKFTISTNPKRVSFFYIIEHPDILKRNDARKMVNFGKAKPGSNFNKLFKSMVGLTRDLNQPGIDKFLEALRRLNVRSNELSGKELQLNYEP